MAGSAGQVWIVETGPSTLQINTSPFSVQADKFEMAAVKYLRDWIRSPYIAGAALANAIPDIVEEKIRINVGGGSQANIQTNLGILVPYLQNPIEFHFNVGGTEYAWTVVGPMDYSWGPTTQMTVGLQAPVDCTFYRMPTALVGPI